MPLYTGATTTTPPVITPPTPPPVVIPPEVIDPGEYLPIWIDPDGVEWELNAPGRDFFTMNAVSGYGITPVNLITRPDPRGGVTVIGVRSQQRTLVWPVRVRGRTHMEFQTRWRQVAAAFALTRRKGPGLFRLRRPDGTSREVLAYYQSGWDGEPGQGHTYDTPTLTLLCPDGFWRDSQPITLERTTGEVGDFFDPYPNISSGDVIGATQMFNPGEVEAWPTWRLDGPATQLVAVNHTTTRTFTVNTSLSTGEYLTITTRPGRVTNHLGATVNGALVRPGSTLWRLEPGVNDVEFTVSGSTTNTKISMSFYPRYETA
ncbi:phage tail domain-containing protein [Verrucosispora sp. NA02020]|uniref:phage distal tail protein n=1 Tax=Verrucosispora sp. NA02020 TaxID=2742132 RepID=UPI0015925018|nr:phage tail domain-containing protein [Verrucosispora sp. NA02020]QKW15386.1 phage tail family protein [Verrucosispora sp. NA02020]